MIDPQTWYWVFGVVAQVYGVILGLFAIMITFGINFFLNYLIVKMGNVEDFKKVFETFKKFSKVTLSVLGGVLSTSILFLALGGSVNYNSNLFWIFGVCVPIVVVIAFLVILFEFIKAMLPTKQI